MNAKYRSRLVSNWSIFFIVLRIAICCETFLHILATQLSNFSLLSIVIPNSYSNSLATGILEFSHLKSSVASDFPITMA